MCLMRIERHFYTDTVYKLMKIRQNRTKDTAVSKLSLLYLALFLNSLAVSESSRDCTATGQLLWGLQIKEGFTFGSKSVWLFCSETYTNVLHL